MSKYFHNGFSSLKVYMLKYMLKMLYASKYIFTFAAEIYWTSISPCWLSMVKLERLLLMPLTGCARKALEGGLQNTAAAILETAECQSGQSVLQDRSSKSETRSPKKIQDAQERITCPGSGPCSTCKSTCTCTYPSTCSSRTPPCSCSSPR